VEKQRLREKIWREMQEKGIARFPLPCWGRIPNFQGAEKAAENLRRLEEWRKAKVIFSSPDSPQRKVRENALKDGKILVMASPRLKKGFLVIKPKKVKGKEAYASTIRGAFQFAEQTESFPKPDLVVTGSVAIDVYGHRLGKGGGYGDRELSLIRDKFGAIPVATTVHDMQVVDYVPSERHDQKVDIIITPTRTIRVKSLNSK